MIHVDIQPARPHLKGLRRSPPNPHTYSEGEVSQQLGILAKGSHWRVAYIVALIDNPAWCFPAPLPSFNRRRGALTGGGAGVTPHSIWRRDAVDSWFTRLIPPGAEIAAAIEQDLDAAALDANADDLAARLQGKRA